MISPRIMALINERKVKYITIKTGITTEIYILKYQNLQEKLLIKYIVREYRIKNKIVFNVQCIIFLQHVDSRE
jgi:hypothetical protein